MPEVRSIHSRCVQCDVRNISDAMTIFGSKNESGQIPLVLIPAHRSSLSTSGWWMSIPTGCYCLLQRFGRDVGEATPGFAMMPPWYRIAYMVTVQSCTYNAPCDDCPTSDNVRVNIDCVLVFRIRDADNFVYKLGAVHFDQLLTGAVEEAIRLMVRKETHRTVRNLRGARAEELLSNLNKKFDAVGVVFSNCTIRGVTLPESLENSLERATEVNKAMERTRREHEYQTGEVERKSSMTIEELERRNEQTMEMEKGKKKRAELNHEQRLVKEQEHTQTATIETETDIQVKRMETTAQLQRIRNDMERLRVETISRAEAEAEARRVQADIMYESSQMNAEAERRGLMGEAEAMKLDAEAEAKATQHLMHKRKHDLNMREKEVLMLLAQKLNYNLVGESGDRLVGAIMTGHLEPPAATGRGGAWFG
mmetsp:Transcript_51279/g.166271  ORF Transcript_51279/g.166271 Transcript_51279/m.166271 type:complete len:423 (-) Transcript_51279:77-1345(-)